VCYMPRPSHSKKRYYCDITYTESGQSNGNTEKMRNRIYLCLLHRKNFGWQHWMYFFCLFTLCSARVSELVIVLCDSLCERFGKLETCPILRGDRYLVCV
jgi:hypothetical protein